MRYSWGKGQITIPPYGRESCILTLWMLLTASQTLLMHWHMATPFVLYGAGELQRVFYRAVTSMTADSARQQLLRHNISWRLGRPVVSQQGEICL